MRKLLAKTQLVSWLVVVQFSEWPDVWNDGMTRLGPGWDQAKLNICEMLFCCSTYFSSHSWYCQTNTRLGCRFGSLKLAMLVHYTNYQLPSII